MSNPAKKRQYEYVHVIQESAANGGGVIRMSSADHTITGLAMLEPSVRKYGGWIQTEEVKS